jgi:hypothetical protein
MAKEKILIVVKTYPTLSVKYDELVCTAGFRPDGTWVRIYPIPFRKLEYEKRFKKYHWVEVDLVKNLLDFRPESYKPANYDEIQILDELRPDGGAWEQRRAICLKRPDRIFTNLTQLIEEAKDDQVGTSLAVFKPSQILDFVIEPDEREWDSHKLELLKARANQGDLFISDKKHLFEAVKKLPYKFSYKFTDETGRESKLMIEDWEIGALYWNCLTRQGGQEEPTLQDVRKKYLDEIARTKDLYFFLGTTLEWHKRSPNPFIIIGLFYPGFQPSVPQLQLF